MENGAENYCMTSPGGLNDISSPQSPNLTYMCEAEVSSRCLSGWVYYQDVSGQEGYDSCLFFSTYTVSSFAVAAASCPTGSHLLTIGAGQVAFNDTTSVKGALIRFAMSMSAGRMVFIGCSQSATATSKTAGWSWVDGTPAGNLNCGGGGTKGCGVWASNQPEYAHLWLRGRDWGVFASFKFVCVVCSLQRWWISE